MTGRAGVWAKGIAVLAVAGALVYVGLRAAYGGFGDYYTLSVDLPRAGQQLEKGSDVRMSGVIVGKVTDVRLVDRRVRLTLQIDREHRVPASSEAVVSLTTLLGAKFVDLRFDRYEGPFLEHGARVARAHVGPELEDALADGVSVFEAIRPDDLATVVSELATGTRGRGDDMRQAIRLNAQLTRLFARTLDPQLEAIHDFSVVFGALRNSGADLNRLADALNEGVPVYASDRAQRDLARALDAVAPFADHLADLLILDRRDWDRMIDGGDRVLQAIAERPGGLRDLLVGLYRYTFRLGGDPILVGDGTAHAGFVNFIGGNDDEENRRQICSALPPEVRAEVPLCTGRHR